MNEYNPFAFQDLSKQSPVMAAVLSDNTTENTFVPILTVEYVSGIEKKGIDKLKKGFERHEK